MNSLDKMQRLLPNGFHDAILHGINIDYFKRQAILDLHLDMTEDYRVQPGLYKRHEVHIKGLQWIVMEQPDGEYAYNEKCTRIDAGELDLEKYPNFLKAEQNRWLELMLAEDDPGIFYYWFYIENHNSFIYVAAKEAELWRNGERLY